MAGTWRGSNGIIYELTQQDSDHFTWSVSFPGRRQWGSGTILGNLVRAEWKDQFSQDVFREAGVIDQRQDQMAMRISWGNGVVFSRFANPQEGEPCFLLEAQAPARRPFIDWQWLGEEPYHEIGTRPWGSSSDPDPRWYPEPLLGWDLLAYYFGQAGHFDPPRDIGNQAKVGFLLFKQRHSGFLRFFVYLPLNLIIDFDVFLAHISVFQASDHGLERPYLWAFPLAARGRSGVFKRCERDRRCGVASRAGRVR